MKTYYGYLPTRNWNVIKEAHDLYHDSTLKYSFKEYYVGSEILGHKVVFEIRDDFEYLKAKTLMKGLTSYLKMMEEIPEISNILYNQDIW